MVGGYDIQFVRRHCCEQRFAVAAGFDSRVPFDAVALLRIVVVVEPEVMYTYLARDTFLLQRFVFQQCQLAGCREV